MLYELTETISAMQSSKISHTTFVKMHSPQRSSGIALNQSPGWNNSLVSSMNRSGEYCSVNCECATDISWRIRRIIRNQVATVPLSNHSCREPWWHMEKDDSLCHNAGSRQRPSWPTPLDVQDMQRWRHTMSSAALRHDRWIRSLRLTKSITICRAVWWCRRPTVIRTPLNLL